MAKSNNQMHGYRFLLLFFLFLAVNYASVMGLLSDTNMHTDQFSNLTLAFYVTYLFFELPTGFLMQRLPTAKYLGFNGEFSLGWRFDI
jgi:fucose permease